MRSPWGTTEVVLLRLFSFAFQYQTELGHIRTEPCRIGVLTIPTRHGHTAMPGDIQRGERGRDLPVLNGQENLSGAAGRQVGFRAKLHHRVGIAGLWEHWKPPEGDPIETCVIVTTAANDVAAKYHDRMPVIVDAGDYARWLDPAAGAADLLPLLESRTVDGLEVAAANPVVNNPRNQGPELLQWTTMAP
jgi:SOS response associated peptidase (SRAP)